MLYYSGGNVVLIRFPKYLTIFVFEILLSDEIGLWWLVSAVLDKYDASTSHYIQFILKEYTVVLYLTCTRKTHDTVPYSALLYKFLQYFRTRQVHYPSNG